MESRDYKNLELNLGKGCDNRCLFCMSGEVGSLKHSTPYPFGAAKKELEDFYKKGCRSLGFLGGEPTLYPKIIELIKFAKKLGYERISITTNGRLCSEMRFCLQLVKAGATRFNISIHSHEAEVEDGMTRVPGNFGRKISAIKNLVAINKKGLLPDGLSINAVVNKKNYKELEKFAIFFKDLGVKDMRFNFMRIEGLAKKNMNLAISYEMIKPMIKKVADLNEKKLKININFGEIPLCIFNDIDAKLLKKYVGELHDLSTEVSLRDNEYFPINKTGKEIFADNILDKKFNFQDKKREELKMKLASCLKCKMSPVCDGVWKDYLEAFKDNKIFKPYK